MRKMEKLIKKKTILMVVLQITALIAVSAVCVMAFGGKSMSSGGIKLEKNVVGWNQEMESSDEAADIQIPYYADIYMEGGSDEIDMYLVNPKENECYFTYTFVLRDSDEQIYQSGLIEPGKALEKVKLDRNMESGEYSLDMRIDTYTLDTQSALNNAIVSTELIVQ